MKSIHLSLVATFLLLYLIPLKSKSKELDYIVIKGACYDYGTGPDIVSTIFAVSNGEKKYLGSSDEKGYFRVEVPVSSKALVFKSKGFHDIELPVRFMGHASAEVEFSFILPTSLLDSAKVPIVDMLLVSGPRSFPEKYTVKLRKSKDCTIYRERDLIDSGYTAAFIGVPDKPKSIDVLVRSGSNETIMDQTIITDKGINFLIVDLDRSGFEPTEAAKVDKVTLPFARTLYFDQSSYNLTTSSKLTLDSVAEILATFPEYSVNLAGYADNLGEKEKNLTLSEFRTRVVARYLEQKGISNSRLTKTWFGAEHVASETQPFKNRRVVVDLK